MTVIDMIPWFVIFVFVSLTGVAIRQRKSNKILKELRDRDDVRQDINFPEIGWNKSGEQLYKCPYCKEWVNGQASVCRFCNMDIAKQSLAIASKQKRHQEAQLAEENAREEARRAEFLRVREQKSQRRKEPKFLAKTALALVLTTLGIGLTVWTMVQPSLKAAELAAYKPKSPAALSSHWQTALDKCQFSTLSAKKVSSWDLKTTLGTMSSRFSYANVWQITTPDYGSPDPTVSLYATSMSKSPINCLTQELFALNVSEFRNRSIPIGTNYWAEYYFNSTGKVFSLNIDWNPVPRR